MLDSTSSMILMGTWETCYMVFIAGFLAVLAGMPLGVLLLITRTDNLQPNAALHKPLAWLVNATRSLPFVILMIAIIPFTRLIVGTSIGTTAAIVPLTLSAIPFVARLTESALDEVPPGLIEAARAMGATHWQIIIHVLLPESISSLTKGFTLMLITLIGYSAMAGAVGGGGLGDIAIRYGYQRFDIQIMLITIVMLIALVQLLQTIGDRVAKRFEHH